MCVLRQGWVTWISFFRYFSSTISLTPSSNLTASEKMKINIVNCKKYSKHVSNFMKFEYGVTNGECVEKKKFGGQNLKKRQIVCRVLDPRHAAKFVFVVCQPQAHGKHRFCRVSNGRTRQTLTAEVSVSVGLAFVVCPIFAVCCSRQKFEFAVCLVFVVCNTRQRLGIPCA